MPLHFLWVIICRLTSTVHLIPIRTASNALELAFIFIHKIIRLHGLPTSIVSDQDSKFMSRFWHELHQILGVQLKFTMAFHPQAGGQVERMIQTIVQTLWAMKLLMAEFA